MTDGRSEHPVVYGIKANIKSYKYTSPSRTTEAMELYNDTEKGLKKNPPRLFSLSYHFYHVTPNYTLRTRCRIGTRHVWEGWTSLERHDWGGRPLDQGHDTDLHGSRSSRPTGQRQSVGEAVANCCTHLHLHSLMSLFTACLLTEPYNEPRKRSIAQEWLIQSGLNPTCLRTLTGSARSQQHGNLHTCSTISLQPTYSLSGPDPHHHLG